MNHDRVTGWPAAAAAAFATAALLAACGGGGGTPAAVAPPTVSPPATPASAPFVDTLPPQTAPVNRYGDLERALAFEILNAIRFAAGLGELYQSPALDTAAQGHADYLSLNDALGLFQTPGQPGFTGIDPPARLVAAGYAASYVVEADISATVARPAAALLDGLMTAPYKRMATLRYMTSDVGLGYSVEFPTSLVMVLAHSATNPQGAPSLPAAVWPADGATAIPRSGCCDAPDPMPELSGAPWGYPVSVHTHEKKVLAVTSFTLTGPGGQVVASKVLSPATDPNLVTSGAIHAAFLMPLVPLAANTAYTASFTGTIDGAGFARAWSFTTGTN